MPALDHHEQSRTIGIYKPLADHFNPTERLGQVEPAGHFVSGNPRVADIQLMKRTVMRHVAFFKHPGLRRLGLVVVIHLVDHARQQCAFEPGRSAHPLFIRNHGDPVERVEPLEQRIDMGQFLTHRREREISKRGEIDQDIPGLTRFGAFVGKFGDRLGISVVEFTDQADTVGFGGELFNFNHARKPIQRLRRDH